jgi:hypothetical protein
MKLKVYLYQIISEPFYNEPEVGTFSYIQNILYSKNIEDFPTEIEYLSDSLYFISEKIKKVLDNLDIRETDITPFLNNIRVSFPGSGIPNGSLALEYSDETIRSNLNNKIFSIQILDEKSQNKIEIEIIENQETSLKDIINSIRIYDFVRIVDDDTGKTIFIGIIKSYDFSFSVDQVYSLTIELASIMDFLQYNHINTSEAIYNKLLLSLPKDELEKNKSMLTNVININALIPFENWFQDKLFEEIIKIIFGDFLFAEIEIERDVNKNMEVPESFFEFKLPLTKEEIEKYKNNNLKNEEVSIEFNTFTNEYKEITNSGSSPLPPYLLKNETTEINDLFRLDVIKCMPSLYNLLKSIKEDTEENSNKNIQQKSQKNKAFFGFKFLILLHFIYEYIENWKPIAYFIVEKNKQPYILKIVENFNILDFKSESLYSILDEIAKNLIYEFFEQIGSTIFFKPPYLNLKEIVTISDGTIVNSISYKYNKQSNPNIYTVNMVKDIIGDLGPLYLLRSYIDFNSAIRYGSNIGGSIVSPFGKNFYDFKSLMELAKLFYVYDIANLNTAILSLVDLFINNNPFVLNQSYDIFLEYINLQLSGYLKDISINYSVDSIPSVNLNFTYIDRIFRKDIKDKLKISRLRFALDISGLMSIKYDPQNNNNLKIQDKESSEIKAETIKSLGLLLIKSNLWADFKTQFYYLSSVNIQNLEYRFNDVYIIGKRVISLFDEIISKPIKLEPLSSVIQEKYLNDFRKNFKFGYESFNINEITIVKNEKNEIFVDIYKLFNFCMSSILVVDFDFNSISGDAVLKSAIYSIKEQIEYIEKIFKYNNVSNNNLLGEIDKKMAISSIRSIYLDLNQIEIYLNQVEILINTKDAMEVRF